MTEQIKQVAPEIDVSEDMIQLRQAAQQLVIGFERAAATSDRFEQIEELLDASAALREIRFAVDVIVDRLRPA